MLDICSFFYTFVIYKQIDILYMTTILDSNAIKNAIANAKFTIEGVKTKPQKRANSVNFEDIKICKESKDFLKNANIPSLYYHQKIAIEKAIDGENICVSTSTSSGKTEIFQTVAIEKLRKNKKSKILAVYSAKALNAQQRQRWEIAVGEIGIIDGDHKGDANRINALEKSVVVMTPDTIHAFLLGRLNGGDTCSKKIAEFIKNIDLIVIDEIHLYRGYFGTNSAYLFRRLNNTRRILRKDQSYPQYITASATLPNPGEHSQLITGTKSEFFNVGSDLDGSPSAQTDFYYIKPETGKYSHLKVVNLIRELAKIEDSRSITFFDSRNKTSEAIYNITKKDPLRDQMIVFKSGLEEETREANMQRMQNSEFKGIISTSALEIGIDIGGLNIAIIANMPYDRNSYYQRIGRVGRGQSKKSIVIILNDGTPNAKRLFNNNFDIDSILPDLEPALYLENKEVQYVQAACHADSLKGGEITNLIAENETNFLVNYFSDCMGFEDLCRNVFQRRVEKQYNYFISHVQTPHFYYSLRSFGENWKIKPYEDQTNDNFKGMTLTRRQMLREAYPGAIFIYHHQNRDYKYQIAMDHPNYTDCILRVKGKSVSGETSADMHTFLYPQYGDGAIIKSIKCGDAKLFNLTIIEHNIINGIRINDNITPYDKPFINQFFTHGVVIFHNAFNHKSVNYSQIAQIIFDAFIMQNAFERNDITCGRGIERKNQPFFEIKANDRFIALYDENKLNISAELLHPKRLKKTFSLLKENLSEFINAIYPEHGINNETKDAIHTLCDDIIENEIEDFSAPETEISSNNIIDVYSPETICLYSERIIDPEEDDSSENEYSNCSVISVIKSEETKAFFTYVIFTDGKVIYNVHPEQLIPLPESQFRKYDLSKGSYL